MVDRYIDTTLGHKKDKDGYFVYYADYEALEAKLAALVEAANEIACSPVEFDDARIGYITMQVGREAIAGLKSAIAAATEG